MARTTMVDASGYTSPPFHRYYNNSSLISILVLVTEEVLSKLIHLGSLLLKFLTGFTYTKKDKKGNLNLRMDCHKISVETDDR